MPRSRRKAKSRRELTEGQYFELLIGPGGKSSAFESPFLRRAAWYEHKDALMEGDGPGQRPWGYWEYEFGQHFDKSDDAVKALRRRGLLSASEEAQLTAIEGTSEGEDRMNTNMGDLTLDLTGKTDDELRGLAASFQRAQSLMVSEPGADFFGAVVDGIEGLLRRREHGAGEGEPLEIEISPEAAAFAARMQKGMLAACSDDEIG